MLLQTPQTNIPLECPYILSTFAHIWVVTRDQFGISALVPQTLFRWESTGGVAKCRLFSQPMCQPGLVI